jgi:nucleotide-binding universal stress UspA family protein
VKVDSYGHTRRESSRRRADSAAAAPRPIVVGIDGTSAARAGATWAAYEAARRGCGLTVVHITNAVEAWPALAWATAPLPPEVRHDAIAHGKEILAATVQSIGMPPSARPHIVSKLYYSAPVPILIDLSRDAQLIVLGVRGSRRLRLAGSVLRSTLSHAGCPVAVIPAQPLRVTRAQAPVVIGIDRAPGSDVAFATALRSAYLLDADVVAVHRGDKPDELMARRLAAAQADYPHVSVRHMPAGRGYLDTLLDESHRAQLLVISAQHSRRRRAASITITSARAAGVPVISVPLP